MKYKKVLIIAFSVIFFISALTSYINRVIFPRLIKKIAVERIEEILKRKVEIGSIHFNWVRGFIIDKIKVYDNGPDSTVFAQAQQVSFGIIIFPGIKQYRITIPYINVRSPSVHLIRTSQDTWNFSDILPSSAAGTSAASTPVLGQSPGSPSVVVAWGGISISDGKLLVDDASSPQLWSEYFDNINLKLSLSYKWISYDFTADIPRKKGFVGATVYYQPFTKNTQAQIHLKNIDTASYLSLINIPDVHMESGVITAIDLNITYAQDKTTAQGNVLMQDLNITSQGQNFKGNIDIHGLDAQYLNGNIIARGQMDLSHVQTRVPGLSAGGSVQAGVNDFELTKDGVAFNGSLHAQNIFVRQDDRQVQLDEIALDNIRITKDKTGVQSIGNIMTKGLFVQWPDQKLQGDISLRSVRMQMKDDNNIWLQGELQADNFTTSLKDNKFNSQHILLENIQLNIVDQKNVSLETKLSLEEASMHLGKNDLIATSAKANKLSFNLDENVIKVSGIFDFLKTKLVLNDDKAIEADPQLELSLQLPLDDPSKLTYKGSITLSNGQIRGFAPFHSLDNVELDADFQNDEATINALSADVLDTAVRINGTVKNFKAPLLNIVVEADELDLSKIKDFAPQLVRQYGLSIDGSSSVKVKFEGLASDPLAGQILAVASVKAMNVASSKLHQRVRNISGIIEATPDSLKWHDFTADYQGKNYSLSGNLHNFKNPKIMTTLMGPHLQLKADLVKDHDLITINALTGTYLNAAFNSTGTITLIPDIGPVFIINSKISMLLEDLIKALPSQQKASFQYLAPTGILSLSADLKGTALDWKNYRLNAQLTSPIVAIKGYKLTDMIIRIHQDEGRVKSFSLDGKFYDGIMHAVGSLDLSAKGMPYDVAFNIENTDMHQLKMDSPLKMEEIDGKFFLTTLAHGTIADFKNNLHASGSLAIRDGFLAEFNLFKGLLSVLNDALRLGQVQITDVESNFRIENQKIMTDNLRLKGPTIVLLGKGWVNFDQVCDLNMSVDLSSGVVPEVAHDVLSSLNIRIYDKISDPKFKRKISVPQVINTLFKNLLE